MPKNKGYKGRNPPKKTNRRTNEFSSFRSSSIATNYYFGTSILDFYDYETLKRVIKDPMGNNQILREISLVLYGINGVYANTVNYITALPTLDKVVIAHGKNKQKKEQNKQLMTSALRRIKDKEIVRNALMCAMVEGVCFYYFETIERPLDRQKHLTDFDVNNIVEINDANLNAAIISLPADYTRIIGIRNSSYVIAFDLNYFNNCAGETTERKLRKYPKEIRDAYYKYKDGNKSGNWVVLDPNKTIVHKINSKRDEQWGRPLVLPAILDIVYSDKFTETKRGVLDEINNRVVFQTFPRGSQQGTSALTKAQQQQQHDAVKGAIMNKGSRGGISFFSVAADTKIDTIKTGDIEIFDDKNESGLNDKIALDLGIASSLLNGVGSGSFSAQQNNLELLTAQVYVWIEQIEAELNKVINENIIKDTKNWVEVNYLPISNVNKSQMIESCKELYTLGRGSLSLWAAACGISPDAFFALLDEEKEKGIEKKYPPHQTSYTLSGKGNEDNKSNGAKGGRPTTDSPSDNTVRSRSNDGNNIPSPSDNQ